MPTSYPELTLERICAWGKVGLVIWGNHAIRAAVDGMQTAFARILNEGGIAGVETAIAPVGEIFRLQGVESMKEIEDKFLK